MLTGAAFWFPFRAPLGGASRITGKSASVTDGQAEPVEIVALDDVVATDRHVSVIQLDVEGHEREALTGASRTISRCFPILVLETLPPDSWLRANILNLGYRIDQRIHHNTVLLHRGS